MERSEQINELAAALAKAQGLLRNAKKENRNLMFNSEYADLSAIWEACREPLSKNGLSVIQTTDCEGSTDSAPQSYLITTLVHSSGQWISGKYFLRPMQQKKGEGWVDNPNPQAMASAITYARRATLAAIVGISPGDDDDGNLASQMTAGPQQKPTAEAPQLDHAQTKAEAFAKTYIDLISDPEMGLDDIGVITTEKHSLLNALQERYPDLFKSTQGAFWKAVERNVKKTSD